MEAFINTSAGEERERNSRNHRYLVRPGPQRYKLARGGGGEALVVNRERPATKEDQNVHEPFIVVDFKEEGLNQKRADRRKGKGENQMLRHVNVALVEERG